VVQLQSPIPFQPIEHWPLAVVGREVVLGMCQGSKQEAVSLHGYINDEGTGQVNSFSSRLLSAMNTSLLNKVKYRSERRTSNEAE
jgi:hypothetical protein